MREREIWGERESNTAWEKMAWVDFDCWSKSTTPENFLRLSTNKNNGRIRRQSSFGESYNILRLIWFYSIHLNNTESTTIMYHLNK